MDKDEQYAQNIEYWLAIPRKGGLHKAEKKDELKCRKCEEPLRWKWALCLSCGHESVHDYSIPEESKLGERLAYITYAKLYRGLPSRIISMPSLLALRPIITKAQAACRTLRLVEFVDITMKTNKYQFGRSQKLRALISPNGWVTRQDIRFVKLGEASGPRKYLRDNKGEVDEVTKH